MRLTMPDFVKVGKIVRVSGISAVVEFQGHAGETVMPDAYAYWTPHQLPFPDDAHTLVPVAPPLSIIPTPDADALEVSVAQAAAMLGVTQKDLRRRLRSGALEGRKEGSKWVGVDVASLGRIRAASPDDTAS